MFILGIFVMANGYAPMEHSVVWWEGWAYLGPRSRNPYQGSPDTTVESAEWLAGWLCRFFGEEP